MTEQVGGRGPWGYARRALEWTSYGVAGLAGLALVTMMFVLTADVIFRYGVDASFMGAHDIVQLAMVVVVFCGFAYAGIQGAHISVDLLVPVFDRFLPRWLNGVIYRLVMGLTALTLFTAAYLAGERMPKSFRMREASNLMDIPYWPFYGIVALGFAIYGLVVLLDLVRGPPSAHVPEYD